MGRVLIATAEGMLTAGRMRIAGLRSSKAVRDFIAAVSLSDRAQKSDGFLDALIFPKMTAIMAENLWGGNRVKLQFGEP